MPQQSPALFEQRVKAINAAVNMSSPDTAQRVAALETEQALFAHRSRAMSDTQFANAISAILFTACRE